MIPLLQQPPQFSEVFGAGNTRTGSDSTLIWALVLGLVLVGVLLLVARQRMRGGRLARADEDVFMKLCTANGLTKHQVYLLRRMYHELKVDNPLLLFVSPSAYDRYESMLEGKRLALVKAIREKVFS